VNRFPFLDWMRGLALVIMIQVHVFNSFARTDVRNGGVYSLAVFAGGMAGPLLARLPAPRRIYLGDRLPDPPHGLGWQLGARGLERDSARRHPQ
jgi:hypothetical protein